MKCLELAESRLVRATEAISSVAQCLRELLENSIDAGSSIITAQLVGSGLDRISVADNGSGIDYSGLHILCDEGATSKQFGSTTNGGRGKALEAINALSQMTVETSTDSSGCGFELKFENGVRDISKCARLRGTSVSVQNLFSPHAVRRRYWLEHKQENLREIQDVAAAFAITSDCSVSVSIDGKMIVQTANQSRSQRIRNVFGATVANGLINGVGDLGKWCEGASVEYFAATPTGVSNGRFILAINKRPCVNSNILRAVRQEFKLCAGPKTPTVVLFISAPRESYEFIPESPLIGVLFENESALQSEICSILHNAWTVKSETPQLERKSPESSPVVSATLRPRTVSLPTRGIVTPCVKSRVNPSDIGNAFLSGRDPVCSTSESRRSIDTDAFKEMQVIGQWNNSFIITKLGPDIFAIDQHAACEAINFEKLRKVKTGKKQKLINPVILSITPEDAENAASHQKECEQLGFEFKVVGRELHITCIPNDRSVVTGIEDLQELLGLIRDVPHATPMTQAARSKLAYRACHSSVRAGDAMSHAQMRGLLERMSASDYPWNCPHGRPTWCRIYCLNDEKKEL